MTARGSLYVVGTGLRIEGQVTQEALSAMRDAGKLFHLVQDAMSHRWLEELNPTAETLADAYAPGRRRRDSYDEMVARILAPVREGNIVCAAFYGHPGVLVTPAHEAIRVARSEGHHAEMLPGISGDACLFADLGVDPGDRGCQSFTATDFLVRRRIFDPASHLLLWQVGSIGVADFRTGTLWNREGLAVLAKELARTYGAAHQVVLYEADPYPIFDFHRHDCALAALADAPVTLASILYVPPLAQRKGDPEMRAALGMEPESPV
jgi:uncharacterized protein YabN with tetrapyrrole methylase and pyrophosphatase domain